MQDDDVNTCYLFFNGNRITFISQTLHNLLSNYVDMHIPLRNIMLAYNRLII